MSQNPFENMPFQELIVRVRAGDTGAFDELFRRSDERLERWMRTTHRPAEPGRDRPSDISQGILERAFAKFASFKGTTEGEWFRWLETSLENNQKQSARDASRQKRAAPGLVSLDEEDAPELVSPERTQSQHLSREQDYKRLYAALFQLPTEQAQALYRRYIKGLDRSEVAEQLKTTKSAVSSLISRGLARLAEQTAHLDPSRAGSAETLDLNEVEAAFFDYLRRREAGEKIDTDAWLAGHPTCARTLRDMLSLMEQLHTHSLPPRGT